MSQTGQTALLTARNLHCERSGQIIINDLDFDAFGGELLGVVGPNGSGKSTLLRALAGLLPANGTIQFGGRDLAGMGPRQLAQMVTLMHQDTNVAAPFTASEVVMMGRYARMGRFRAESPVDRAARDSAMDFTDTLNLRNTAITAMSGGERQRVLLAKALAQDTDILLLDEPSSSLDIAYQEQIFACAVRVACSGKAVVAAVHDLRAAARHCNRLVLMSKGKIIASGSPELVLTSDNLSDAYGLRMRVWRNQVSGLLDLHPIEGVMGEAMPHVHVIGGGGSAAGVLRLLGDDGYRVSAGVLTPGDSDLLCAGIYGFPVVTGKPFSLIGDSAFRDNCDLAAKADLTILCNCAWGVQNLRNLEAAACAGKLLIIEDDDPASRDFSGGKALALYQHIRSQASVLESSQLGAWLDQWNSPE